MRALAVFERYLHRFAVTEDVLRELGFRRSPPAFHSLVAEADDGGLVGLAVYYFIPFTATARPTLFVKELYVAEAARGRGRGARLMQAVAREALRAGCDAVKWQVAPWNEDAIRFYERLGARADHEWLNFGLSEAALRALAGDDEA